jgi:signal peptidase I
MVYDFTFMLTAGVLLTGAVVAVDRWVWSKRRDPAAPMSWWLDYSHAFFPVLLIVLLLRNFAYEPFRIPSDSMMPTLLDGDFILVNKYDYGFKLPVLNTTIIPMGTPQRGDVVVFRKPGQLSVNYIKRLIGLPGDHILIKGDAITVNGKPMAVNDQGIYQQDSCYAHFHVGFETLSVDAQHDHQHHVMYCPSYTERVSKGCTPTRDQLICTADDKVAVGPEGDLTFAPQGTFIVPPGFYFFMGDNRDNSADSRFQSELGYVPVENVVGHATRIWLSFDGFPHVRWQRLGQAVE